MTVEAKTATYQISRLVHLLCTSTTSSRPVTAHQIRTHVIIGVLSSASIFLLFLGSELLLDKLSETVVFVGNAPQDRPAVLVCHLIGNRASFLGTEAPMLRVPQTNFLQGITSISGARCSGDLPSSPPTDYRSRHQHRSYRVPWSRCIF